MNERNKFYSDIQRYEIININDGEKYGCLFNHDLIIDQYGNFKSLVLNSGRGNGFFSKGSKQSVQIPWNLIRKIGAKTIIIDFEDINEKAIDLY